MPGKVSSNGRNSKRNFQFLTRVSHNRPVNPDCPKGLLDCADTIHYLNSLENLGLSMNISFLL